MPLRRAIRREARRKWLLFPSEDDDPIDHSDDKSCEDYDKDSDYVSDLGDLSKPKRKVVRKVLPS